MSQRGGVPGDWAYMTTASLARSIEAWSALLLPVSP
jgi:hypothetical protein